MTSLADLGWDDAWARAAAAAGAGAPARIAIEHRGAYEALGAHGLVWAELRGKDYFEARDKTELPTVGDWVLLGDGPSDGVTPIDALLPRRSVLVRAAAGERTAPQPIAANVDVAFVVTSANQELNERRLERYLATIQAGRVTPMLVLNKVDLVDDPAPLLARLAAVAPDVATIAASAARGDGVDALLAALGPGRTGVVVGSSGVGKSTLLNRILGAEVQPTREASELGDRGRHTTTRRELFVLAGGGLLIDTPGMRELKPWIEEDDAGDDDALAFDDVAALAAACRFGDCKHVAEPGCAVRAAVEAGELPAERLAAYRKLAAEQASEAARRRAAPPKKDKAAARALRKRIQEKS